jgi:DNA-binding NarL/FixJ family response regulator
MQGQETDVSQDAFVSGMGRPQKDEVLTHMSMRDLTMRPAKPEPRKCGRKPMAPHFSRRELQILDAAPNPQFETLKQVAAELGVTEGTCKVYLARLYQKLGIPGGTFRLLTIWAMTHEHVLPQIGGGQY